MLHNGLNEIQTKTCVRFKELSKPPPDNKTSYLAYETQNGCYGGQSDNIGKEAGKNLITVGLLEDIQNVSSHRDFGAAPFLRWLGPRSLVVWNEINAYMKRVGDWAAKQEPRREACDDEKALSQVENPQLKKIIESMYRKKL